MIELLEQMLVAEREERERFRHAHPPDVFAPGPPLASGSCGPATRGCCCARRGRVELIEGPAGPGARPGQPGVAWPERGAAAARRSAGLVLFTDGLFEGRAGPGSERLGEDGLLAMARDLATLPAAAFVDALLDTDRGRGRPLRRPGR